MTKENGSVVVSATFPLFGKVYGEKTVKALAARKPTPGPGGPAVTATPLDKPKTTTGGTPAPAAPIPAEPIAAAPPPVTASRPPARPAASEDELNEKKAKRLLGMARTYYSAGMKDKAAAKLKEIIEDYPRTKTALDAKLLLEKCT